MRNHAITISLTILLIIAVAPAANTQDLLSCDPLSVHPSHISMVSKGPPYLILHAGIEFGSVDTIQEPYIEVYSAGYSCTLSPVRVYEDDNGYLTLKFTWDDILDCVDEPCGSDYNRLVVLYGLTNAGKEFQCDAVFTVGSKAPCP